MKKFFATALAMTLTMTAAPAFASDLAVILIDNNTPEQTAVSLDDMQLGTTYPITGYAKVQPLEFRFVDFFAQFGEKEDYGTWANGNWNIWQVASYSGSKLEWGSSRFNDASWMESGDNAQFAWLPMDITNLQKTSVDFIEDISIKVVYQDDYEFAGWIRQIDTDLISKDTSDYGVCRLNADKADYPDNIIVLNPAKTHPIDMLYTGHYVIGCTLPNSVVNDTKSPLRIEIKMGENDLTYHIIK